METLEPWLNKIRPELIKTVRNAGLPPLLLDQLSTALMTMSFDDRSHPVIRLKSDIYVSCKLLHGGHNRVTGLITLCTLDKDNLVHELTHWIGGTELDARLAEQIILPNEYKPPVDSDFTKFKKDGSVFFTESQILKLRTR